MSERADAASRTPLSAHPALWLTLAAILLRLIVFTSRGDYIAYDEGWYLLLGRSVFDGEGYRLSGLRHTTLSPLFPLLAGAAGVVIDNIVWGGRVVAAVTAGLLVWPCWHIFRRIAGRRSATVACAFIVVMPSLTPFAAPYWIEWDLWVGAEPVLHLFLFGALAMLLRARDSDSTLAWALTGILFSLAYLARPEAIIPFGIAGLAVGIEALARRSVRRVAHALLLALAFAAAAAPYWLYLHDTLGRWALSGRMVDRPSAAAVDTGGATRRGSASGIERMLWEDDDRQYVRTLYGLDPSGTRLASTYWGVPDTMAPRPTPTATPSVVRIDTVPSAGPRTAQSSARTPPSRWLLYARSLGTIVPWFLWPFVLIGIPRRKIGRDELLVTVPIALTSLAIARMVGADPRTQLLVVPIAVLYAAMGVVRIGKVIESRVGPAGPRPGFVTVAIAFMLSAALASTVARWFYLGVTMGSPHHAVGAANRQVGDELDAIVPDDEPIMSWHPATALYADREWRVLPFADLAGIVRYANAIDCEYVVLSAYYPGSKLMETIESDHLILMVPPGAPTDVTRWHIELQDATRSRALARLRYSAGDTVNVQDRMPEGE